MLSFILIFLYPWIQDLFHQSDEVIIIFLVFEMAV